MRVCSAAGIITRASKYLTFVTRHDPKTPATVDGFVLLESIASRTHLIRALRNLVREGLSVTADALAAVADFVSTHSKARFEIKHSPWVSAESILSMGLLLGGKRTRIHLTTYPLNTQGFVEVRGHRPYAIAVDLVKCLHAGVALYIAGGETVLTSGVAYTLTDGQEAQGVHPSYISAV